MLVKKDFNQIMELKNKPDRSYLKKASPEAAPIEASAKVGVSEKVEEPAPSVKNDEITDNERYITNEHRIETFYQLAEDYYKEKRYSQMLVYYKKAADLGHGPSMNCIGYAYSHGEGVPVDQKEAFFWYMKGAEAGCAKAQYNEGRTRSQTNAEGKIELVSVETGEVVAINQV